MATNDLSAKAAELFATAPEVEEAWAAYKAATADREAKQAQNVADKQVMETAIAAESASYQAYIDALMLEHQLEDEVERLINEHEPPPLPPGTSRQAPKKS